MFALDAPSGQTHQYLYSGFGIGRSGGLSTLLRIPRLALPKVIVKGDELSGSGSTTDFTSMGWLYLTDSFKGADLANPKSLEGGTIYLEGAAGYLLGGTGSFMLLGINRDLLLMGIVKPEMIGTAIRSAPAALVMGGVNEGLQDTRGFAFMFGQVIYKSLYTQD
ncbi:hypothetical protein GCT13_19725 [Paraburkholderia sp. CNPSo 3157]|uniref:Uncharacterized protein n=1 Tax=Paraburkholderia franconis TaxID=2654983 RepID=A0A7X1THB3_9BURK|nr:hypothetical protein [Paraburkholderia franconis]MPW19064.1 hypothetical protein [Paraburkholderia franconis]